MTTPGSKGPMQDDEQRESVPVSVPTNPPVAPPLGFKPYGSGGFLGTVYLSWSDGTLCLTGRMIPFQRQHALRRAVLIYVTLMILVLVIISGGGLWLGSANTPEAMDSGVAGAVVVLILVSLVVFVTGTVYVIVSSMRAKRASTSVELRVPVLQVSQVRVVHNSNQLLWWLLIGPFALIPYFVGRRVLQMKVPLEGPTRPPVLLSGREFRHGDAELIAEQLPRWTGRSRSTGRRISWAFAIVLLLVGIGGFAASVGIDNNAKTSLGVNYSALGERDAATAAETLRARVAQVKAAYDAYVAANQAVYLAHENVTSQFNDVVSPLDPLLFLGPSEAKKKLPQVIAAYDAAVAKERAAQKAYVKQLALLKAEMAP